MGIISDTKAKNIKPGEKPIAHGGVTGLRLEPGRIKGTGKWILRFVSPKTGKRRDMGLGSYPDTGIADAGKAATAAREQIGTGLDPIEERRTNAAAQKTAVGAVTFEAAARQVHAEQAPGWNNPKHIAQWIGTLEDYIFPNLGKIKVADLTPKHFSDALRPIWLKKPETASRTKQRCHVVMAWCWAHGMVAANAVDVIEHLLPKQTPTEKHQPAMPWAKIPSFMDEHLRNRQSGDSVRAALEFLILTAARSGAVRLMTWSEVDMASATWTIPPTEGRKTNVPRRVPLSDKALDILQKQKAIGLSDEWVFPSPRGKALSDMTLTALLRRTKAESDTQGRFATAHGFRSAFRDWASENGYPRDLAERQLSHEISNKVEAAYHRTDLLDQRRPMIQAWADFLTGNPEVSNVANFQKAKKAASNQ